VTLSALIPAVLLAGAPLSAPAAQVAVAELVVAEQAVPMAPVEADQAPVADAPHRRHAAGDPLERFNRDMFGKQQKFDTAIFRPAAMGYKRVVPKPVRSGLRQFFSNLSEPIVFLNYMLQFKPGKAAETLARFSINSTLGLGGLIDIAKTPGIRLPRRDNGFGNTLGFYGVKPGPYLFLPFIGPTSVRDLIGGQGDGLVLPLAVGKPFDRLEYQIPRGVVTGLDLRAESDDELRALFDGAVDPYATLRSAYQQSRQGEIDALHGGMRSSSPTELRDDLADPAGSEARVQDAPPPAELSDPLTDPAVASKP
jgi:phospholipid-binding lipoprotein MlaA